MVEVKAEILVVDDDPYIVELITMVLEPLGYIVHRASDGLEALKQWEQTPSALILLDMRMPHMNGWEFSSEFRKRHDYSANIVVVTAAENAAERARGIGANGFLSKPFSIDDLISVAERYTEPPK